MAKRWLEVPLTLLISVNVEDVDATEDDAISDCLVAVTCVGTPWAKVIGLARHHDDEGTPIQTPHAAQRDGSVAP